MEDAVVVSMPTRALRRESHATQPRARRIAAKETTKPATRKMRWRACRVFLAQRCQD
jgi:hypothetical protein